MVLESNNMTQSRDMKDDTLVTDQSRLGTSRLTQLLLSRHPLIHFQCIYCTSDSHFYFAPGQADISQSWPAILVCQHQSRTMLFSITLKCLLVSFWCILASRLSSFPVEMQGKVFLWWSSEETSVSDDDVTAGVRAQSAVVFVFALKISCSVQIIKLHSYYYWHHSSVNLKYFCRFPLNKLIIRGRIHKDSWA